MAVGIVSVAAILAYPHLFCSDTTTEGATNARWGEGEGGDDDGESSGGGASGYLPGALRILGWSWSARRDLSITLHAAALYLGPIFALLLDRLVPARVPSPPHRAAPPSYPTSSRRWSKFRDLVFAPLFEEVVFRSLLCAPLLLSGLSGTATSWIAPLFFGIAHVHHAYLRYRDGNCTARSAAMGASFQFGYTTLFGAYATHAFERTASLPAVTLCHSFCNYMGLPDLSFLSDDEKEGGGGGGGGRGSSRKVLRARRKMIKSAYALGILIFISGFSNDNSWGIRFFPEESVLPKLLGL